MARSLEAAHAASSLCQLVRTGGDVELKFIPCAGRPGKERTLVCNYGRSPARPPGTAQDAVRTLTIYVRRSAERNGLGRSAAPRATGIDPGEGGCLTLIIRAVPVALSLFSRFLSIASPHRSNGVRRVCHPRVRFLSCASARRAGFQTWGSSRSARAVQGRSLPCLRFSGLCRSAPLRGVPACSRTAYDHPAFPLRQADPTTPRNGVRPRTTRCCPNSRLAFHAEQQPIV